MNNSVSTLVFAMLLVIHGAHVTLIGLAGLVSGNFTVAVAAAAICLLTRRGYRGILRRYA